MWRMSTDIDKLAAVVQRTKAAACIVQNIANGQRWNERTDACLRTNRSNAQEKQKGTYKRFRSKEIRSDGMC